MNLKFHSISIQILLTIFTSFLFVSDLYAADDVKIIQDMLTATEQALYSQSEEDIQRYLDLKNEHIDKIEGELERLRLEYTHALQENTKLNTRIANMDKEFREAQVVFNSEIKKLRKDMDERVDLLTFQVEKTDEYIEQRVQEEKKPLLHKLKGFDDLIKEMETSLQQKEEMVLALMSDNDRLKRDLENFETRSSVVMRLKEGVKKAEGELDEMHQENAVLIQNVATLTSKLENKENELEEVQEYSQSLLEKKVASLKKVFDDEKHDMVRDFKMEETALSEQVDKLQKLLERKENELLAFQQEDESQMNNFILLQEQSVSLNQKLAAMTNEMKKLQQENIELSDQSKEFDSIRQELEQKIVKLEEDYQDKLAKKEDAYQQNSAMLQAQLATTQTAQLNQSVATDDLLAQNKNLLEVIQSRDTEIDDLKEINSDLRIQNEQLATAREKINGQLAELRLQKEFDLKNIQTIGTFPPTEQNPIFLTTKEEDAHANAFILSGSDTVQ